MILWIFFVPAQKNPNKISKLSVAALEDLGYVPNGWNVSQPIQLMMNVRMNVCPVEI